MATTLPSGLAASVGISTPEPTYGYETTPTHWLFVEPSEKFEAVLKILETKVLWQNLSMLQNQRVVPTIAAKGGFSLNVVDRGGMGQLFQAMFGSSTSAVDSGSAYKQIHQINTGGTVNSVTIQKNLPATPSGTIYPFTYPGFKVGDWEFNLKRGEQLKLTVNGDAQYEDTSFGYVAPSFTTSAQVFHFGMGPGLVAGTSGVFTNSSGVLSVTGGTAFAGIVGSFTLKGTRKFDTERYNIGDQLRQAPIENDFLELTGTMEIEFESLSDYYDYFAVTPSQKTQTPLQMALTLAGPTAITGSIYPTVQFILPSVVFDTGSPMVDTMGPIICKPTFKAFNNGTDGLAQLTYITPDNNLSPSNF